MFSDCNNSKTGGKEGTMKKTLTVLIALAFACSSIFLMASCAKKQVKVEEAKPMAPEMKKEMPKVGDTEAYKRAEAERLARLRKLEKDQQVLAAIQGLYEIVQEKDAGMAAQQEQIAELTARLDRLEALLVQSLDTAKGGAR